MNVVPADLFARFFEHLKVFRKHPYGFPQAQAITVMFLVCAYLWVLTYGARRGEPRRRRKKGRGKENLLGAGLVGLNLGPNAAPVWISR